MSLLLCCQGVAKMMSVVFSMVLCVFLGCFIDCLGIAIYLVWQFD